MLRETTDFMTEASAAAHQLEQTRIAVQVRQNQIRAIKNEAAQMFSLAQQPPVVSGAATARVQLTAIEAQIPPLVSELPALRAAEASAQGTAREAGLQLLRDTGPLLNQIVENLRAILPMHDELIERTKILQRCACPLPGNEFGAADPHQELLNFLFELRRHVNGLTLCGSNRPRVTAKSRENKKPVWRKGCLLLFFPDRFLWG